MATLKLYRCHNPNCRVKNDGKFQSDAPAAEIVCPQCGIRIGDPKFGHLIERQPLIHFDPPSKVPGYGQGVRACDQTKGIQAQDMGNGVPNPWHAGTGLVQVVTCPGCTESQEYQDAVALLDEETQDSLRASLNRLQTHAMPV